MTRTSAPTAIDLYAGVGGWSLGFRLAGIETVASYEWWEPAARTHSLNLGGDVQRLDIRSLEHQALPANVSFVVGSPPCTQFSFANRGGSGDLSDGLRDIEGFLEIVEHLRPKYWAMENVPRVAAILERELGLHGRLHRFAGLVGEIQVVDMSDFGLPQARKRMLAGSFPVSTLLTYRSRFRTRTLGDVITALEGDPAVDPLYKTSIKPSELTQNEVEPDLGDEELRLNREAKEFHPFYNVMRFPDRLDRPSRTVTATCTRVSRESIVISDSLTTAGLRRLTLRERACLQGFPITFQFHGRTYGDNLKLVGNAIPPLLTYYVGHSMLGTPGDSVPPLDALTPSLAYVQPPSSSKPIVRNPRYPVSRRFRAALPGLRFGSGVRFELSNKVADDCVEWRVCFFFGPSKRVLELVPHEGLLHRFAKDPCLQSVISALWAGSNRVGIDADLTPESVQAVWNHSRPEGVHPFGIVDDLGSVAERIHQTIVGSAELDPWPVVAKELQKVARTEQEAITIASNDKLRRNASRLLAGLIVGGSFNTHSSLATSIRELVAKAV